MALHTHASYGLAHLITGKYGLDLTETDVHWNLADGGWGKGYVRESFYRILACALLASSVVQLYL